MVTPSTDTLAGVQPNDSAFKYKRANKAYAIP